MKKLGLIMLTLALILVMLIPAGAVFAEPATITVDFNQAQFQWRGSVAFGDWSYSYQNSPVAEDYVVKGNTLHTSWTYSPVVTNLRGASTVYNYDKKSGLWIEKEGTVKYGYVPGYGDYDTVNKFRGYIEFDGAPSAENFVHGVAYQWVYLYAPRNAELTGSYTEYAHWDDEVNAWLVGFSIYLWDTGTQSYTIPFPDPFIEPVPANDYNPLDL